MSARVSREFKIDAAIHYDSSFIINSYLIVLDMDVITEDIREQNISLERIKFILEGCIDNCIMIHDTELVAINAYASAGIRVCTLPEEPYDQIVAAVIMSKLNAVAEGKLSITEVTINSKICDGVSFHISREEDSDFRSTQGVWWTDNSPSICDVPKKSNKKDKIVQLRKDVPDWIDLGLGWKEPESHIDPKFGTEIVFMNLDKQ